MFAEEDIIYTYTRQNAIEDGVLIDLTDFLKDNLPVFKIPVAITRTAWTTLVVNQDAEPDQIDVEGYIRLHNLVIECAKQARAKTNCDRVRFKYTNDLGSTHVIAHVGPGDNLEPVFTIMMDEDD